MKKIIPVLLLAGFTSFDAAAQSLLPSTLNVSGGTVSTTVGKFDWSVGEMAMVTTLSSNSIIITQGVLQPTKGPNRVKEQAVLSRLNVYPNPASAIVNLQYTSAAPGTLFYRIIDLTGKVLLANTALVKEGSNIEQLNISSLACSSYLLEVAINCGDASATATYKIQKIN